MDTLIVSMGEYNNTELYIGSSFLGAQQSNITHNYPQAHSKAYYTRITHSEEYYPQ